MGPVAVTRSTPAAHASAALALACALVLLCEVSFGTTPADAGDRRTTIAAAPSGRRGPASPSTIRTKVARPVVSAPEPAAEPQEPARTIRARTETGEVVVARVYGQTADRTTVLLPDGQIRFAPELAFADDPFRPASFDEMRKELQGGPFKGFVVLQTPHYLIFYQSSAEFAQASGKLLEELYRGITEAFHKQDIPTREAEFPLVAVIFETEKDFRAYKPVAPEVQAYYEIITNRIYFYQHSAHDQTAPEVAALRRPQTVAHEGTHQILANIGIQPRLSSWPMWLVEGLAEYCSPPSTTKKGNIVWKGLGEVNPIHMATIHDLDDQADLNVGGEAQPLVGRDRRQPLVEYVVMKQELTPTDYALAWAVTHYLANKRVNDFVAFMAKMSKMPPLEERTPRQHLEDFRDAFGRDLVKLDRAIGVHLAKLKYKELPYYTVLFVQPIGGNQIKRAAMVSRSPLFIRQWIDTITVPQGDVPQWEARPFPTRTRALMGAEEWLRMR